MTLPRYQQPPAPAEAAAGHPGDGLPHLALGPGHQQVIQILGLRGSLVIQILRLRGRFGPFIQILGPRGGLGLLGAGTKGIILLYLRTVWATKSSTTFTKYSSISFDQFL